MPAVQTPLPLEATPTRTPAWPLAAMGIFGVALFCVAPDRPWRPQYLAVLLAVAIALVPPVARRLSGWLDLLRTPSPKVKWITGGIVFVLAARYFLYAASLADRDLFPVFHDEFMYLLQARMLAAGRLWMPPHPLAEFFDSFFVIVKPVYAAAYFPGTALLYVPEVWLGLPPWMTALMVTALAVTMLYVVMSRLIDGVAGLLAVLLALSLDQVRVFSVMSMSHPAVLLLFLLTVWAYLRWRDARTIPWAVALGAFAGWTAITRPLDALCLIAPLGLTMLWDLRRAPRKRAALTLAAAALAALPFLALQLILDKGVTGHWLRSPITLYGQRNFPGLLDGGRARLPAADSPSPLPQVRDYYRLFVRPELTAHAADSFAHTFAARRWLPAADVALPVHLLFVLLPPGLLACRRRPAAAAVAAGALIVPLVYTLWPFFLSHYALVVVPAFVLLVLLAGDALRRRFPSSGAAFALAVAMLALFQTPMARPNLDAYLRPVFLAHVNATLASLEHTPAVVLFKYQTNGGSVHQEPVFNIDTAWPDDAAIVRAHDLGPVENRRIFAYYAQRQPDRYFYRYDRSTGALTPLGYARELAAAPH